MSDAIRLDSGRRSFAVQREEMIEPWWYDIVELKLCFEELQRQHCSADHEKSTALSTDFIKALASALDSAYGLNGCTIDMAYQIYYIVSMQFNELHRGITEQVRTTAFSARTAENSSF